MIKVSRVDLINGWLKYHNTNVELVQKMHTPEELENWFDLYPCTKQQGEEWEAWAIDYIHKKTRVAKRYIKRKFGLINLDCGPKIIDN
jgi:hypothetical protein